MVLRNSSLTFNVSIAAFVQKVVPINNLYQYAIHIWLSYTFPKANSTYQAHVYYMLTLSHLLYCILLYGFTRA